MFNGVEVWGVGWQESLRAASALNELAGSGGLMETGVVIDHNLSWCEDRHQTVLDIGLEEGGVAGSLEHEGSDEMVLMKGIEQTHALGAIAGLLPPARFALRTPAIRPRFVVLQPRFIQIDTLLCGHRSQLRPKLFPHLFVPLGIAKGLFLCVQPSLRSCRQTVIRFTPPQVSANSSTVASPCVSTKTLNCSGSVILWEWPR